MTWRKKQYLKEDARYFPAINYKDYESFLHNDLDDSNFLRGNVFSQFATT